LFKKVFDMKIGEVAPVYEERNDVYLVRPLNVKTVSDAKFTYVRVYPVNFVTSEVGAEEAAKKAEEAMEAFRREAEEKGSLEDALENLQKAMPEGKTAVVETEENFDLADPPAAWGGKEPLLKALRAAKPGDVTPPVKVGAAIYVAKLESIETPNSVTVDWAYFNNYQFENSAAVSKEEIQAYYNEHKEDYRRDEEREVAWLRARPDAFKEDIRKEVTDEMLKKYFEENIKSYQHPDPEGNMVTSEFEDVKHQVKNDYVNEKAEAAAREAMDAARKAMADEDADLQAIADEHNLEYRNLGFVSKSALGRERDLRGLPKLADDIFALEKGGISEVKTSGSDRYVFRVQDVKESFIPELEDVMEQARRDTDRSQQPERALAAMEAIRRQVSSAMKEGKTFEAIAEELSATFPKHARVSGKGTGAFTRLSFSGVYGGKAYYAGGPSSADVPGLPGGEKRFEFTRTAFSLAPGEIAGPVSEKNERQSVFVMTLSDRVEPEEPTEEDLDRIRMSMEYTLRSEMVDETINRIVAESLRVMMPE